jgi:hypothetical protein
MCNIDGYTTQEYCSSGKSDNDHSDEAILNTDNNDTNQE